MGSNRSTLFVDVLVPLAVAGSYTYRVPNELNEQVVVGKRVVVQFGKTRTYTALIQRIHNSPPPLYEAKYILSVIDNAPIVQPWQFEFWQWMSSYYMCNMGEVMNAALPAALKLASETRVILNRQTAINHAELTDKEYLIVEALEIQPELSISDIAAILGQKVVFPYVKSLFDKQIVLVSEEIEERYKPKMEVFITLNPFYDDKTNLAHLFDTLSRAPKQSDLVLAYIQLAKTHSEITKKALLEKAEISAAVLTTLIEKELFIAEEREISRFKTYADLPINFILSPAQQAAFDAIKLSITTKKTALLHGVTSSGKTQVYIKLIEDCIANGQQALYLLPEIALTTQIISRLRKHFGNTIGIYHSKFSDNERAETWKNVLNGTLKVILGARSAIFLPFSNLGLIIVDEEHEQSYKQQEPAPRYHARDAALYLGNQLVVPVVLGSATPALETYFNATQGKYTLVTLTERYGGVQTPEIIVADIQQETKKKTMQSHFTSVLLQYITTTLEHKEQIILFQNRRGYAPSLSCNLCAYTPRCINCDVSLTYHKFSNKLQCHYCGYQQKPIDTCPACGHAHINTKNFGTEKVEDELQLLLPKARIARMDLDTTRKKTSTSTLIHNFENRETDILVGTQMVAKGLDFDNLTLTCILNADSLLNFPDFRAYERSFQLMLQVAGRAGRREKRGSVIIQTYQPLHPIIQFVVNANYNEFYTSEISERKQFNYPPYYRLIQLTLKHKDLDTINAAAQQLATVLRSHLGKAVLGPEFPAVNRIRNLYHKVILIKVEKGAPLQAIKSQLSNSILLLNKEKAFKSVWVQPDVDPY